MSVVLSLVRRFVRGARFPSSVGDAGPCVVATPFGYASVRGLSFRDRLSFSLDILDYYAPGSVCLPVWRRRWDMCVALAVCFGLPVYAG